MHRSLLIAVLLVGFAQCGSENSHAAIQLFGGNDSLFEIDPTDGSSIAIDVGNPDYRLGLAYNSLTSTMYSMGFFTSRLSTVDLVTGATTLVATSNVGSLTGLTFSGDFSTLYSLANNGGPLVAVDPVTGAGTIVSGVPVSGGLDLATDSNGNVYVGGFGGISLVNTVTGIATPIGGTNVWTAIAFDDTDTLYGIDILTDSLYTIDTATGAATLIGGDIGDDVRGMAFVFGASQGGVPEPSQWLVWSTLACCCGTFGARRWRRN